MSEIMAVLTGDIVASRETDHAAVEAALETLRAAARDFGGYHARDLKFTRFRGDGWQVCLDPHVVLDACLYFIARLRASDLGVETRLSAGIGRVDHPGSDSLSDASGPAFFVSGDHLETMNKHRRMVIAGSGIGIWQAAVFELAESLALGWTPAQAEAVALSLASGHRTQDEIAGALNITRQAVQSRLAAAGYAALHEALHAFRTHSFQDREDGRARP